MNNIITRVWCSSNPVDKIFISGGLSGAVTGWCMAVNDCSKQPKFSLPDAIFTVSLFTAFGTAIGVVFPAAVPTYAIIKGIRWYRNK